MKRTAGVRGIVTLLSILVIAGISAVARGDLNIWTSHGPEGMVVWSLAIDPLSPRTIYAAGEGGAFKSTDGGGHWTAVVRLRSVRSLAVDPANPGTVYAAEYGSGVYKSVNGGSSWSSANAGLTSPYVEALAIDPKTPATLYAGSFEYGCEGPCMFKSTNGAGSWSVTGEGLIPSDVLALTIDPVTSATLYAGTYGRGAFKSTDAGDSWRVINAGLPQQLAVSALAVDPSAPKTLYAGTYREGVFKSADGGEGWTAVNTGLPGNAFVRALVINAQAPATLYVATEEGVFKSGNGGDSWTALNVGLSNRVVLALAIDPVNPARLYAGTYGGGVFEYVDAPELCAPGPTTLCLNGGRFAVTTRWSTRDDQTGPGQAVALTADTGYFTFFDPANVEILVKVLNGCGVNSRYWTFAAGLTDVNVILTVADSLTGSVQTYTNEQGVAFQPIQDTSAFATCP